VLVALSQVAPKMCGALETPWHRVLLKQPGKVPAGAGVDGCPAGLLGDPGKWHRTQIEAFPALVVVCVLAVPRHGFGEWGAATVTPWQPSVLRQVAPDTPPLKPDP
jgi:hypothetical protein